MIHPFSFIGRDSSIGADCVIGPFAVVPRESIVPEGSEVVGMSPERETLRCEMRLCDEVSG